MSKPPIFILGNRRSGTTMLRLMLTCHPNIAIPPEGGFVVWLGWKYGHLRTLSQRDICSFVEDLFKLDTTQDWELDRDSLLQRLTQLPLTTFPVLVDGIYQEYIRRKFPHKTRWGDKTTWYLNYLSFLDQYFPQAQFIHIIRDGRAVAASFKRVPHLPNDVGQVAMEWAWGVKVIAQFGQQVGHERYLEVHYEALVARPEDELRRICEFLHEPYSTEMMNFAHKNREQKLEPERHLGWKALTLEDVTTRQVSKWKNELTNPELARFWAVAGETMAHLGYESCEADLPVKQKLELVGKFLFYQAKQMVMRKLRPNKARVNYIYKKITFTKRS